MHRREFQLFVIRRKAETKKRLSGRAARPPHDARGRKACGFKSLTAYALTLESPRSNAPAYACSGHESKGGVSWKWKTGVYARARAVVAVVAVMVVVVVAVMVVVGGWWEVKGRGGGAMVGGRRKLGK